MKTRRVALGLAALLVAATLGVYGGVLGHSFLNWDDWEYVTGNPLVLGRRYAELLRSTVAFNFHPLTMLTLAWNVGDVLSPRPFLATNVALHAIDALLVFRLAWLLSGGRLLVGFFVALLFGIHPMHVESVAWIAERKDVLYALFFHAAAIAYWSYLERAAPGRLLLAFALFVLSCLAKGMAVTFPLVMVLLDLWKGRTVLERRALLEKIPFFAVALLFALIALDVQAGGNFHGLVSAPGRAPALTFAQPLTPLQRIAYPASGYAMYLWRLWVPLGLCPFYPYPGAAAAHDPSYLLGPLFLLATLAVAAFDLRRGRRVAFAVGWYVITIAPVLQWIPVGAALMADRYAYVPYLGPTFLWAMGLEAARQRSRALGVTLWCASVALAALFFVVSVRQVATWRDDETLWTRAIEVQPSGVAFIARGNGRLLARRFREAMSDFHAARAVAAPPADVFDGLGNAYAGLRSCDSSLAMYDRALAVDSSRAVTYRNRALAESRCGQPREALADLDRALAIAPADAWAIYGPRGYVHKAMGQYREAVADFDRALAISARDPVTLYNRGFCLRQLGDRAGAVADFRAVLALDPGHAAARAQLEELER